MPAPRSLFPRRLEPAFSLSSPESRLLKFHTISVCTSSTVRAAIRADRDRRANLRAHKPPTIFAPGCTELEERLWLCAARRQQGVEVEREDEEEEMVVVVVGEEEEEGRREVELYGGGGEAERHRATVW